MLTTASLYKLNEITPDGGKYGFGWYGLLGDQTFFGGSLIKCCTRNIQNFIQTFNHSNDVDGNDEKYSLFSKLY